MRAVPSDLFRFKVSSHMSQKSITTMALFRVSLLLLLAAYTRAFTSHSIRGTGVYFRRNAFSSVSTLTQPVEGAPPPSLPVASTNTATANGEDVYTIQILMSDTGGGHRASANALRDAFDVLYPGKIQCDIVDIYTDYGPFWPFNDYVNGYKIMAEYSFLWEAFFYFGATDFGLCLNDCFARNLLL